MLYEVDADGEVRSCGLLRHRRRRSNASKISWIPKRRATGRCDEALRTQQPVLVEDLAAKFPDGLPTGAWSQSPHRAVLLPILPNGETSRAAILVVGLNPFRLFDEGYRGFLELAAGQIAATIANAQAYEEERRRAQALEEINRQKTAFFSNVSHEFRTPLTLMLGPLEDLLADHGSVSGEEGRALVEVAHRNALRLLKLVNSLLDFSRLEAGRARADFEPVDLAALTAELASNFRSVAEKAGLKFEVAGDKLDRTGLCRPRHVGEGRPQPLVERVQVHARRRDPRRTSGDAPTARPPSSRSRTREPAYRPTNYRSCSSVSTRSVAKRAGPSRAPASASRWSRKSPAFTAAAWRSRASPDGAAVSRFGFPFGIAHLPPEQVVMDASSIGLAPKEGQCLCRGSPAMDRHSCRRCRRKRRCAEAAHPDCRRQRGHAGLHGPAAR